MEERLLNKSNILIRAIIIITNKVNKKTPLISNVVDQTWNCKKKETIKRKR